MTPVNSTRWVRLHRSLLWVAGIAVIVGVAASGSVSPRARSRRRSTPAKRSRPASCSHGWRGGRRRQTHATADLRRGRSGGVVVGPRGHLHTSPDAVPGRGDGGRIGVGFGGRRRRRGAPDRRHLRGPGVLRLQSADVGSVTGTRPGAGVAVTEALAARGYEQPTTGAVPDPRIAIHALDIPAGAAVLEGDDGLRRRTRRRTAGGAARSVRQRARDLVSADGRAPARSATASISTSTCRRAGRAAHRRRARRWGHALADDAAPAFWVLADPEGNEACVCTWQGQGLGDASLRLPAVITRMSELFLRTLRDDPADAEVPSHKLLSAPATSVRSAPGCTPGCRWACGCCARSSRSSARRWMPSAGRRFCFPRCCRGHRTRPPPLDRVRRRHLPAQGPPR